MAEATENKEIPKPDWQVPAIERNGVSKGFSLFRIVKGKKKDKFYPCPDISNEAEFETNVKWFGIPTVLSVLQTFAKRVYQDVFFSDEVIRPDGTIDWEAFAKNAADFAAAGMKMAEIDDKLDELQAQLGQLILKMESPDGSINPEVAKAIRELNTTVLQYKDMKEKRSRKPKEAEEPADAAVSVS